MINNVMPVLAMNIGGYNIPMIDTVMPWALLILIICVVRIIALRFWHDKDINLKKMAELAGGIGLGFFIVLSIGLIIMWIGGLVEKAMQIITKIQV